MKKIGVILARLQPIHSKQVIPTSVYENRDSIKQLITLSKLKQ